MFRFLHLSTAFAIVLASCSAPAFAAKKDNAAGKEAVEKFLLGKYVVSAFSPGRGPSPGGVVVQLMKPGLESAAAQTITPAFSYKDGRIKKTLATNALKELAPLPYQTRLHITKIEARENHVLFDLVTTEAFDGLWFKAALHIEMGKGYLETPDLRNIDATIGEVLMIEGGGRQSGPPQQTQPQQPPRNSQPTRPVDPPPPPPPPTRVDDPPPPPPPPAADAVVINPGMTVDQVKKALGAPAKVNKLGTKEIMIYPNMKVTLVNGKVTDVE